MQRRDPSPDRHHTPVGISVAGGSAAVVVAALTAALLFPGDEVVGRLLVIAVVVGVYAATVADVRAALAVTGIAALVFIGFVVNDSGELRLHDGTWSYLIPLAFAAILGRGQRWIRPAPPAGGWPNDEPDDAPTPPPTAGPARSGSAHRGDLRQSRIVVGGVAVASRSSDRRR